MCHKFTHTTTTLGFTSSQEMLWDLTLNTLMMIQKTQDQSLRRSSPTPQRPSPRPRRLQLRRRNSRMIRLK